MLGCVMNASLALRFRARPAVETMDKTNQYIRMAGVFGDCYCLLYRAFSFFFQKWKGRTEPRERKAKDVVEM